METGMVDTAACACVRHEWEPAGTTRCPLHDEGPSRHKRVGRKFCFNDIYTCCFVDWRKVALFYYSPPNLEPAQGSRNARARVRPQTDAPAVAIGPHRSGGPGSGAKVISRSDESRARAAMRSSAGLLRRLARSSRNSKRPPTRALAKTRGIARSSSKLAAGAPARPVRTATAAYRGDRPAERSAPSCKRTPGRIDRGPSDLLVRRRVWPPARVPP